MSLPSESDWGFGGIAKQDPLRAAALQKQETAATIINTAAAALNAAFTQGSIAFGRERSGQCSHCVDHRAVVQFLVPQEVYDQFFNGRSGYRAHFWEAPDTGRAFNGLIIDTVQHTLAARMPDTVAGRELSANFEDLGEVDIAKDFVLQSLHRALAKFWICTILINLDLRALQASLWWTVPPTLDIPRWSGKEGRHAPYPPAHEAWLEIKGGFLGDNPVYQPKCPRKRAHALNATGWT